MISPFSRRARTRFRICRVLGVFDCGWVLFGKLLGGGGGAHLDSGRSARQRQVVPVDALCTQLAQEGVYQMAAGSKSGESGGADVRAGVEAEDEEVEGESEAGR